MSLFSKRKPKLPGYYPGYSTLSQQNFWDATTRKLVVERVESPPSVRFFNPEEAALLTAVCDRVIPQDDRPDEFKIPIANWIDQRLYENKIEGYRYEDMPSDREAHRLGLEAIELIAQSRHQQAFLSIDRLQQDFVLKSIHDGDEEGAPAIWSRMNITRYWMLLVQDCITAYYAHPYAWDEIGFGGPAYPRGYMRLEGGKPEPWEKDEQRYEWKAPADSISDVYEPVSGGEEQSSTPGQGGTH